MALKVVRHLPKKDRPKVIECPSCAGAGRLLWDSEQRLVMCSHCEGRGWVFGSHPGRGDA